MSGRLNLTVEKLINCVMYLYNSPNPTHKLKMVDTVIRRMKVNNLECYVLKTDWNNYKTNIEGIKDYTGFQELFNNDQEMKHILNEIPMFFNLVQCIATERDIRCDERKK